MLITAKEIIQRAFSPVEKITPEAIGESKIAAAEEKYLRPAFGRLYDALAEGRYPEFTEAYVKPALAYFVRYGVIPDLSLQVGNSGVQTPFTLHANAATDRQREMARAQAMDDAEALLRKAVRHVENNPAMFPEYEPRQNVGNRIKRNGGIIL